LRDARRQISGKPERLSDIEPITLVVSEPLPPGMTANQDSELFMDYVTKHTDGKVMFEVYDSGTLHPMQEALSAIESGLSDITLYMPGLFSNEVPSAAWATGLAAFAQGSPQDMLAGIPASWAVFGSGAITDELAAHNATYLGSLNAASYTMACTSSVETLEDAKGKLARTTGGVFVGEAESIGMVNVLMDTNEVFEGLQHGAVDCTVTTGVDLVGQGLGEVAPYNVQLQFSPNAGPGYIMSKEKYDALPADVQEVFRDAGALYGIGNTQGGAEFHRQRVTEAAEENGVAFVDPSPKLAQALAEYRTAQGETLADTAPDSVKDPHAVIDRFTTVYADWVQILELEFGLAPNDGSADAIVAANEYFLAEFDWERYRERIGEYLADLD
jgi:TRAP-type transport system periplasmic protein